MHMLRPLVISTWFGDTMSTKKKIFLLVGGNWSKRTKSGPVVKPKGKKATSKKIGRDALSGQFVYVKEERPGGLARALKKKAPKKKISKKATKKKTIKKIPASKLFHRNSKKKATKAKSGGTLIFDSVEKPGVIDTLKPPKPPKGSK